MCSTERIDELVLNRSTIISFRIKGEGQNIWSQDGENGIAASIFPKLAQRY